MLAGSALLSPLYAEDLAVDSTITHVMVYPSSAMITRTANISLPAGENTISLNGLPLNLLESSLRVAGESSADVQLGSVELQQSFNKDLVQEKERKLREQIESLNEEKQVLIDSLAENKDQLNYIRAMASNNSSSEQSSSYKQLPIDQWNKAWETLATATSATHEKIRKAQKRIKMLDKTLTQRQQQLEQVATHQRATRTAVLNITTAKASELKLNLRYQIHGAHWKPVYDADLDTQSGKIQLKSLAQITQRTGEDWNDVKVTLSTLRPSASSQLPNLNPWVIDFMPDRVLYQKRKMSTSPLMKKEAMNVIEADDMKMDNAMPMSAPPVMAQRSMTSVASTAVIADFSAEYKVPNKISLASGNNKRRVTLQSHTLDAKVSLASVPRLDPRAMLIAKTQYKGETPLLAGTVALHRDGNFIGNSFLAMHQSGEEIKLSFGEDDKVKITFIPDPDKKGKDGLLFGKRKTVKRNYHFTVANQHDKTYNISFSDTIPVAANEDIKVTMTGDKPSRINDKDKKGIAVWERKLAPHKTIKLEYGYEVTYPEDKTVTGL